LPLSVNLPVYLLFHSFANTPFYFNFPHFFMGKSHFLQFVLPPLYVECVLTFAQKRMVKILIGMFRQLAFEEGLMFCICDAGAPFCIV